MTKKEQKIESVDFEINGGNKLSGTIKTKFSKNGSVGLLCASLLNKGTTTLGGISRIEEVYRVIEVLESIGVKVTWEDQNTVKIVPPKKFNLGKLNIQSAIRTRSAIMLIGPLVHFIKSFSLPHAYGCHLGKRTVSAHGYALESLGGNIKVTHDEYQIKASKLKAQEIIMYEAGDTACENALMMAALLPGKTTIKFASSNYMVQEICFFLKALGVNIEGIGTPTITVHGVEEINQNVTYQNSEDPIEAMTFIVAAIATDSTLTISRAPIDFLELELFKLEKMGLKYDRTPTYKSENGYTNLVDITIYPSKLVALEDKIHSVPFPGINMDNLPYFVIPAIKAKGQTLIHDWAYENRAIYMTELNRMGTNISLIDPHRLVIEGGTELKPAQIVCPPALRPSMAILVAMLGAKGKSILRNVYVINRGYEEILSRLNSIGADIKIIR